MTVLGFSLLAGCSDGVPSGWRESGIASVERRSSVHGGQRDTVLGIEAPEIGNGVAAEAGGVLLTGQ